MDAAALDDFRYWTASAAQGTYPTSPVLPYFGTGGTGARPATSHFYYALADGHVQRVRAKDLAPPRGGA